MQYEQKLNMLKPCNLLILLIGVPADQIALQPYIPWGCKVLEERREKTGDILSFLVKSGNFMECKCNADMAGSPPALLNMGYILPGRSRSVTTFLQKENELLWFHDPGSHTESVDPLLECLNRRYTTHMTAPDVKSTGMPPPATWLPGLPVEGTDSISRKASNRKSWYPRSLNPQCYLQNCDRD